MRKRERHNKTRHIECEAAWKKMTAVAKREKEKNCQAYLNLLLWYFNNSWDNFLVGGRGKSIKICMNWNHVEIETQPF